MRITLFTYGSRGDTQPFVALAVRLMHEGQSVKLAAPPDFAGLAAECGVDFAPLGHSVHSLLNSEGVPQAIESGQFLKHIQAFLSQKRGFFDQLGEDIWQAAQGTEAIIYRNTLDGKGEAQLIPATEALSALGDPPRATGQNGPGSA